MALAVAFAVAMLLVPTSGSGAENAASRAIAVAHAARRAPTPPTFPTPIQHVFEIYLENQPLANVLSEAPYQASLYARYAGLSNYYSLCHPSAPNYLASTSGIVAQCGSDNYTTYSTRNLGDLLSAHGDNWTAYLENMPSPCYTGPDVGLYAQRHNPWIFYSDILSNASYCDSHVVGFGGLNAMLNGTAASIPNYVWISPNLVHDGHDSGAIGADRWLSAFIPELENKSWFSSTAVILQYDESSDRDVSTYPAIAPFCTGTPMGCGGHTYAVVVSPYTLGSGVYTANATDFSLLSTIEWLLGLGSTGNYDGNATFAPLTSLFHFSGSRTSFDVSGNVTDPAGAAVANATVTAAGGSSNASTKTTTAGSFFLSLPNGTYRVTAAAPGYAGASIPVTVRGADVGGLSLVLAPQGIPVSGFVERYDTLARIPNATIFANLTTNGSSVATRSAGNGSYEFGLSNGTFLFTVLAPGYQPFYASVLVAGVPVSDENLTPLAVVSGPTVHFVNGTVAAIANGGPIGGAAVFANSSSASVEATTSADGNFSLELTDGSYVLTAVATGFASTTLGVVVNGTDPPDVAFALFPLTLAPPRYAVGGQALVFPSNEPAADATVIASSGSLRVIDYPDPTGHFDFLLVNGTYSVEVVAPGFHSYNATVTMSGSDVPGIRLVLFSDGTSVYPTSGSVESASSGTGITDASVRLAGSDASIAIPSGPSGTFAFALPNGTYSVVASAPGYRSAETAIAVAGGQASPVTLALAPLNATGGPSPFLPWSYPVALVAGLAIAVAAAGVVLRRARPRGRRSSR